MSGQLGVLEVVCDAPPYAVVRACEKLGFHDPLDVRWIWIDHLTGPTSPASVLDLHWWLDLVGVTSRSRRTCSCGNPIPVLRRYLISPSPRWKGVYLLGQCSCCHTMYWDETG